MATRKLRLASLSALRHRSYLALWLGAFVSNVGTWMETIGLGVYVTEVTGKAGWTGTVAALMYMPAMIFGPIGGALADRFDRRKYLAVGALVQTVIAAALAILAFMDALTIPAVSVIAALAGIATALTGPAFTALLVDLVPAEDLHSAISLSSAQYNLGRIVGPMLAAAVITWGGLTTAFLINAISFVGVLAAMVVVKTRPLDPLTPGESVWGGIVSGLNVVKGDTGLKLLLWGTGIIAVTIAPFIGLIPVMAIKVFGRGAPETSLLVACQGIGAVIAAVAAGTIAEFFGRRRLLETGALMIGVVAAFYWLSPRYALALLGIALLGAVYLIVITGMNTALQSRVSRQMQARISSMFSVLLGGGYALGLVAQGWLGDRYGLRAVPATFAAAFFLVVLAVKVFRPTLIHTLDQLPTSQPELNPAPLPTLSTVPPSSSQAKG